MLRFDSLAKTPVTPEPFDHFVAPGLLDAAALRAINTDFPDIRRAGIFPLSELAWGPAFARLIDDIRGPEMEAAMSEKFGVDLGAHPLMITVRGHCRKKDGRIHTDTLCKVVTVLLYLNEDWKGAGGRLRLLRGPSDLDDMIAEVPPAGGTLVAFRRTDDSYHGHAPFVGPRRYVMFNWITNAEAAAQELARHRMSSRIKKLVPFV